MFVFAIPVPKLKSIGITLCLPPIGPAAKLNTAWRPYESLTNMGISNVRNCSFATRRQHQLSSAIHLRATHNGFEIRVWCWAQGAEVFVLPNQRAQRCDEVCDPPHSQH